MLLSTKRNSETGFVAVGIVLMTIVVMTLGLSFAARTSKEAKRVTSESESVMIFNAAESGIEQVLSADLAELAALGEEIVIENLDGQIQGSVVVEAASDIETTLEQGEATWVDLSSASLSNSSTIGVQWSQEAASVCEDGDASQDAKPASLIISIYSSYPGGGSDIAVRHATLAGCTQYNDNFRVANDIVTAPYNRSGVIDLKADDLLIRITPVYNDTKLKVSGSNFALPAQSYTIKSQARGTDTAERKAISVTTTKNAAPSFLDYTLVSGSGVVK